MVKEVFSLKPKGVEVINVKTETTTGKLQFCRGCTM